MALVTGDARLAYVSQLRAKERSLDTKLKKVRALLAFIEDADPLTELEEHDIEVEPSTVSASLPLNFKGMSYRDAVLKALAHRPQTAPELADTLVAGGLNPDRKKVKMNVDSVVQKFRTTNEATRDLEGKWQLN